MPTNTQLAIGGRLDGIDGGRVSTDGGQVSTDGGQLQPGKGVGSCVEVVQVLDVVQTA